MNLQLHSTRSHCPIAISMKNKFKRTSFLGTLALLSAFGTAQAAPTFISTAQGKGADLNVRGGAGFDDGNFGDHDVLRVRNSKDLLSSRKTYLRFDLATLPDPVTTASGVTLGLRLTTAEGKSAPGKIWTFNVFGLKDGDPSESWSEKAATWLNAPANDATSALNLKTDTVTSLGTFTITGTGVADQVINFSTPALLNFLKSDTNGQATLIITRQEVGDGPDNDVMHIFASKEHDPIAPPVLSVAFNGENAVLPTTDQWAKLPAVTKPWRFQNEIDDFGTADLKTPPTKGGILFVGSSSIRLWKTLAEDFPGRNVLNRGFGGSYISDSVHFVDKVVMPYDPKMIVFYAGTNDLADKKSPETILADYMTFVSLVRAKYPNLPIAFISVAPAPSRWGNVANIRKANSLVADFSKLVPNLKFIDIFPLMLDANGQPRPELFVGDQLHMKPEGYAIWKKAVEPFLPKP
ncbi:DNRLRE domain-containing protein [bacterium]|nr:MAG: DNRLRE domain-containing protein [bacterium]